MANFTMSIMNKRTNLPKAFSKWSKEKKNYNKLLTFVNNTYKLILFYFFHLKLVTSNMQINNNGIEPHTITTIVFWLNCSSWSKVIFSFRNTSNLGYQLFYISLCLSNMQINNNGIEPHNITTIVFWLCSGWSKEIFSFCNISNLGFQLFYISLCCNGT